MVSLQTQLNFLSLLYWSFMCKTSVIIRLPALQKKFSPNWQIWVFLLADSPPGTFPDWHIWVFLLADSSQADFLTGRFGYFCQQIPPWQITWLTDLGISAGRFPKQISWLADLGISASKFPPRQITWLADLGISASRLPPGIFPDWQIWVFLQTDSPLGVVFHMKDVLPMRVIF